MGRHMGCKSPGIGAISAYQLPSTGTSGAYLGLPSFRKAGWYYVLGPLATVQLFV